MGHVVKRDTYKTFKLKLANQERNLRKKVLQDLTQWAFKDTSTITESNLYSVDHWDLAGKKLSFCCQLELLHRKVHSNILTGI